MSSECGCPKWARTPRKRLQPREVSLRVFGHLHRGLLAEWPECRRGREKAQANMRRTARGQIVGSVSIQGSVIHGPSRMWVCKAVRETPSTPGWVRPMRESLGSAHRVLFHLQPSARGPFRRDTGEKLYLKRFAQSNMLKRRVAARGVRQLVHSLIGSDLCCNAVKNFVSRCRLELRVHGSAFFACQVVLAVDVLDARSSVAPRIIRCRGR